MGRKLIEIKKITDRVAKEYAFAQRKRGLLKKTIELGILCDLEIALVVFDPEKNALIEYSTEHMTDQRIRDIKRGKLSQHQRFVNEDLDAL